VIKRTLPLEHSRRARVHLARRLAYQVSGLGPLHERANLPPVVNIDHGYKVWNMSQIFGSTSKNSNCVTTSQCLPCSHAHTRVVDSSRIKD